MAIISPTANVSHVFFQQWNDDAEQPGEQAILINQFDTEIEIVQNDNTILISRHEIKAFIKHLQTIKQ